MAPPRDRRPGFSRRAQYGVFIGYVLLATGAVVGAVLLLLSSISPQALSWPRGALREITVPVSYAAGWVWNGISGVPASIGTYFHVHGENRVLRARLARDEQLVLRARALVAENRRLKALLAVRDRAPGSIVTARVVSSSASSTRRFATLNAGSRQRVRAGQPVLGPNGLIGRVIETSLNTARILLIIDPESIVPVRRARDNLPAIVVGRGDGLVDVRSASVANAPLLAGDTFVTSGAGGIFPPGVPVAQVLRSARDSTTARPFANVDALDIAIVQPAYFPEAAAPPAPAGATP
ncbi:rod shape-determining protein MreC [Sphingomonas sp. SFZ2018-12]|uniref:rod shape-determining protein MreC n=1 Tax=Sphingomonas sp. SFZ2018-12 TaxID=2683197 RepID=UPI001F10F886|nr:rod shape-determining protein MreC [Sphingomonas sp. SFZ2018-12]MCH4892455.1 rod shape-determining protein MreC [Sphingomonas sp. SFZ2018-12]